ncbi:MAG: SLC13 family permease [Lacipirellulaceae bacterium]
MPPLLILAIAVALVLGLILVLRLNAFIALISVAVVVSLLAPGELEEKIPRVAVAFGVSAGKIGIPIAMAAIIGSCLLASGAADRIVRGMLSLFGEKRGATALAASGFTLSIPVFFDTVFFLLVPLAKSLYQQTKQHYLKYLLAIGAGGAVAHTLIPPTPGPLMVASELDVDVGLMMLVGIAVGLPSMGIGLLVAGWLDRHLVLTHPPKFEQSEESQEPNETAAEDPGLFVSSLPIVLPVLLVASQTILKRLAERSPENHQLEHMVQVASLLGNPNFALLLAAAIALGIYVFFKRPTRKEVTELVDEALMSGGVIVLITAAGGAFGAMLQVAEIGTAIKDSFATAEAGGMALLWLAFGIASLMKVSQGSGTTAMITSSAMLAAMLEGQSLAYNPVYLAQAIGCGALFGVWMNDSGFWLFCRMGGLTESEGLKTWTVILAVIGITSMLLTVGMATAFPMAEVAAN